MCSAQGEGSDGDGADYHHHTCYCARVRTDCEALCVGASVQGVREL
jgi:hypothetical protein